MRHLRRPIKSDFAGDLRLPGREVVLQDFCSLRKHHRLVKTKINYASILCCIFATARKCLKNSGLSWWKCFPYATLLIRSKLSNFQFEVLRKWLRFLVPREWNRRSNELSISPGSMEVIWELKTSLAIILSFKKRRLNDSQNRRVKSNDRRK